MDRHNRRSFKYDIASRKVSEIYSESDTAWFEKHSNHTSFINDDEIIFESEIGGYNNLYSVKIDGTGFQQVAGGNFTILESAVDTKNGKVYFSANAEHPYEYFIYESDLSGSYTKRLTYEEGDVSELRLSPDGSRLFYSQSYFTKPNELHMLDIQSGISNQVTNTTSPKVANVEWNIPEIITITKEEDGDPYSFYILKKIEQSGRRCWNMECRLYEFSTMVGEKLLDFCIKMFRKMYFDMFGSNMYVEGYKKKTVLASLDCEQLLVNIIELSKRKSFCNVVRVIVMEKCLLKPTKLDTFDLSSDDSMLKKSFGTEEDLDGEIKDSLKRVFDGISDMDVDSIMVREE